MKKCVFCLILALSLLLSACGMPARPQETAKAEPAQPPVAEPTAKPIPETTPAPIPETTPAPIPETTPDPTPEPTPTVPSEPVLTAYAWEGDYADSVGNDYHYIFLIPAINSDSKDALRLNNEAYRFVMDLIQDDLDTIDGKKGFSLYCSRAVYLYWLRGDLVSVLISISNDWGQDFYMTMNYSFSAQRELSREEMLALAGLDEDGFLQRAAAVAGEAFGDPSKYPSDMMQFAEDQYSKTVMPENLQQAKLFFNSSGKLCMAVPIYSMAGADYYWRVLEL